MKPPPLLQPRDIPPGPARNTAPALDFDQPPLQPEFLDMEPEAAPPPPYVPSVPPLPQAAPPPAPGNRPDPFSRPEPNAPANPFLPPPLLQPPPPPPPPAPKPPPSEGPARVKGLVRKARQQVLMDRTVEAIRTLEQAVQLEPDADVAFEAWLMLGQLRLANPAWSTRSIDALQNASRIRPKAAEPWATMGELYLRKGFMANAGACYRRALELDPSVAVPPDVDLEAKEAAPAAAPAKKGLFGKVRSLLGGSGDS